MKEKSTPLGIKWIRAEQIIPTPRSWGIKRYYLLTMLLPAKDAEEICKNIGLYLSDKKDYDDFCKAKKGARRQ